MIYMVSYDINSPGNNRKEVIESLEKFSCWCKCATTTYLIKTQLLISDVEEIVTRHLDETDSMIICQVSGNMNTCYCAPNSKCSAVFMIDVL